MPDTIVSWLDGVGSTAFTLSAVAFVALNGIAIAAVLLTRDRGLVNRWTPHFLAANILLLGTGLGVPLAALAARTVITVVTPSFHKESSTDAPLRAELEGERVAR
jgi:hypothetical protein